MAEIQAIITKKVQPNEYSVQFDLATPLAEKLGCSKEKAAELLANAFMKFLGII